MHAAVDDPDLLSEAILDSLERLLAALELEPLGDDRFRMRPGPNQFDRVFGGQLLAQSVVAAGATVDAQPPQSLHAYFAEAGDPRQPLDIAVERVRDGRSMSTRRITVTQEDRTLLVAIASFHDNPVAPELPVEPLGPVPSPEELPQLQHWARDLPPELDVQGRRWIERPPPVELRIGEPPSFFERSPRTDTRMHWMRLPRDVGVDPVLHAALLAHASDYLLLDMLMRTPTAQASTEPAAAFSLDHSLWIHRPIRFDRWHLYTQEVVTLSGHRGLVRGTIQDEAGHVVASVMQEGLVRPMRRAAAEPNEVETNETNEPTETMGTT